MKNTGDDDAHEKIDYQALARKTAEYKAAAKSKNTKRAVEGAVRHFTTKFGRKLPCSSETLCDYLSFCAETGLKVATIEQRRALIGYWHRTRKLDDPNNDFDVRETMKGIRAKHDTQQKQATPLKSDLLEAVARAHDEIAFTENVSTVASSVRPLRDKALLLTGFWFGLRASELVNIRIRDVTLFMDDPIPYMTLHISTSKTDRGNTGRQLTFKSVQTICPVMALNDWIEMRSAGTQAGSEASKDDFLFTGIDRWGNIRSKPIHVNSVNALLRKVLAKAGIKEAEYSSHSMRRGMANWLVDAGGNMKDLMSWVGWRDLRSATHYVESVDAVPWRLMDAKLRRDSKIEPATGPVRSVKQVTKDE